MVELKGHDIRTEVKEVPAEQNGNNREPNISSPARPGPDLTQPKSVLIFIKLDLVENVLVNV